MTPDQINGVFELTGGLFLAVSCYRVICDKEVKGVSLLPTIFFNTWGFWNLFFYPSVGAWWSFWGGISVVTVNTVWTGLSIYYRWFYRRPLLA